MIKWLYLKIRVQSWRWLTSASRDHLISIVSTSLHFLLLLSPFPFAFHLTTWLTLPSACFLPSYSCVLLYVCLCSHCIIPLVLFIEPVMHSLYPTLSCPRSVSLTFGPHAHLLFLCPPRLSSSLGSVISYVPILQDSVQPFFIISFSPGLGRLLRSFTVASIKRK